MIILQKKAQVLINRGYHYPALKILKEIQRIENSNSTVSFLIGIAYCSLGEISKAISNFDRAIAIGTDDKEDYLINAGTTLEQIGQYELAIRYFKQLLDENKANTIALYETSILLRKIKS